MNTNKIKNIFVETEKNGADVLKDFQRVPNPRPS